MRHDADHPAAERLQAYAAEELAAGDRAVVSSHLEACAACHAGVAEWRALFAALEGLPAYSPAAGFADRVMAQVSVPVPWRARAAALAAGLATAGARHAGAAIERVLPRTTRGWAVASAFLALPVLAMGALLAWLLSQPYVTPRTLWLFATDRVGSAASGAASWAFARLLDSGVAGWLASAGGAVFEARGMTGIGVLAGLFCVATAASAWVLYTNLIRAPRRDTHYASYSF